MEKQEAILRLTNFADGIRNSEEARPTELKLIEAIDTLISEVRRLYGVVGKPHDIQELARKVAGMDRNAILHNAVDSYFDKPLNPSEMIISAMPKMPSVKSYVPESDFNSKKHEETCAKNRAKRRKKKRR